MSLDPISLLLLISVLVGIVGVVLAAKRRRAGLWLGIVAITLAVFPLAFLVPYLFYGPGYVSIPALLIAIVAIALGVVSIPLGRRAPDDGAIDLPATTPGADRTNGLALASIIVVWFSSVVGLILGHVAIGQIKRTGEQGRGMAVAAVTVGWVLTGLGIIATVVLLVAYSNALSAIA